MIGVQSEGNVEGALHDFVGPFSGQRIQEIRRQSEFRIALDDFLPIAQPIKGGDDGRRLRHQLLRFAHVGFGRHVVRFRIVDAQHRYGGPKDVHRLAFRNALEEIDDRRGNRAVLDQRRLQLIEFGLLRQSSIPEKEYDLFEGRVFGQRVDVIALIAEYPAWPSM